MTVLRFGRWSPDLISQQVLSPLMNGFLAAATSYLVTDWIFRRMVMPYIFPTGRSSEVARTTALGVQGRTRLEGSSNAAELKLDVAYFYDFLNADGKTEFHPLSDEARDRGS